MRATGLEKVLQEGLGQIWGLWMPETGEEDANRGEGATDVTDHWECYLGPLMGKENYFYLFLLTPRSTQDPKLMLPLQDYSSSMLYLK